jgi:DNA recombination protein RmuC
MTGGEFIVGVGGLILGIGVGWVLVSNGWRRKLEAERLQRTIAETRLAELEKSLHDQRNLLLDTESRWKETFENLSSKALLTLQQGAREDFRERQVSLEGLLKPLEETLRQYQQRLQQGETNQAGTWGEVRAQIENLLQNNLNLAAETIQLRRVLSSHQARGRWGEETLRRVIESAGMSVHCDFVEQSVQGDGKPDLVVQLPGNRSIIIDAKVPDLEFLRALEMADEVKRKAALEAHASKLKQTIKALADRNYPSQFAQALDYVVLFLPAESLFSAALEGDRELIQWASDRKIILATPASLIAILRAVSLSWQQHVATEGAQQIVAAGTELYDRISKFVEHLQRMREGLQKANLSFNEAIGSLERRVLPGVERLKRLGIGSSQETFPEVEPLDIQPREPLGAE